MKSVTQVLLPIALVVGLIFGVTYISNYTRSNRPVPNQESGPAQDVMPLKFGHTVAKRDPEYFYLRHFRENYEVGTGGRHDFWFHNPNPQPAELRLDYTNCACSSVDIGVVAADAWGRYQKQAAASALAGAALPAGPDVLAAVALAALVAPPDNIRWEHRSITEEGNDARRPVEIPAADPARGPQLGIFRLNWDEVRSVGPKGLGAKVLVRFDGTLPREIDLRASIAGVPPVLVWPPEVDVGELTAGARREVSFFCFSATRPLGDFAVTVTPREPHPCVRVGTPEPLSPEEVRALEAALPAAGQDAPSIASGYRVAVTVHERIGQDQLDLGPIWRVLRVTGEPTGEQQVVLRGLVRGDLQVVGGPDDRDLIDLGQSFSSERGTDKAVKLVTNRLSLELELLADETRPNYLEVELESVNKGEPVEGQKQWRLSIGVPARKLYGSLPSGSGVSLKVTDTATGQTRRIRIPVQGKTYDSSAGRF
ncbi:MAG TPA: hypothetical protein VIL46_06395 [Gemmataceae bacterium]